MMAKKRTYEQLKQKVRELEKEAAELKQAEEEMKKFSAAVEQSIDGIAIGDLEPKLAYVNDAFAQMHGYSPEEMIGMKVVDLHNEEQMDAFNRGIHQIKTRGGWIGEIEHIRKDGTPFATYMSVSLLKDNEGKPAWILAVSRDITEVKRREEELKFREEFSSRLLNNSPNPIIGINPDTSISYVNPALESLTGFSSEELIGTKAPYPFWRKGMVKQIQKDLEAAMRKGAKSLEEPFQKKNGEHFWVDITSLPIIHEGKIDYYLANWVDITERKRAEEALRESEEKYRTLIEMAHDAIIIGKGNYLDYNKASLDLFGCSSREQIYGKTPFDFSPPTQPDGSDSKERSIRIVEKAMAGEPQKFYWRYRKVDGTPIETEVSLSRIEVRGDFVLLGIIRDITERKHAEEALQKAHDELERRVEERTAELVKANKELRAEIIQRKQVENALLENTHRLNVAYEQAITYAQEFNEEMAERKRAEEKLLIYHEKLQSLASKLSLAEERQRRRVAIDVHDHIAQNLALAKMKLGVLRASIASGGALETMDDILKLVDETIQDTRTLISELGSPILYELGFVPAVEWLTQQAQRQHGIVVDFEDDGQPKSLSEDVRVLLFQAVRELLVNIAKHAKARTAKVSITRNADQIRVDVEDDGVGFDSAEIGSSVDTTGRFGLFSIRVRLEPLGGHMEVDSKPSHGTRVTLVAPLKHNGENKKEKVS